MHRKVRIGVPDGRKRSASGGESGGIGFTSKAPANFNLWEEEEARQLYLLHSNLIVDRRFRRSGAVCSFATHLSNASAKVLLFCDMSDHKIVGG